MSRKSNLRRELILCLRAQDRRGASKFEAKQAAKAAGGKYEQVTGIFSTSTLNTYSRSVADFAEYAVERDRYCRTAEDARQYIDDYHAHLVDKRYSAWTVRTRVMGVLRAYGLRTRDLARPLPARRTADITRSDRGREYVYKSPERRSHAERRTADIPRSDRGREYVYKSPERRSHAERVRRALHRCYRLPQRRADAASLGGYPQEQRWILRDFS